MQTEFHVRCISPASGSNEELEANWRFVPGQAYPAAARDPKTGADFAILDEAGEPYFWGAWHDDPVCLWELADVL